VTPNTVRLFVSDELICIEPDATLHQVAERLAAEGVGTLVVTEGERIVGIVSERDVVRKLRDVENARDVTVASIMTTDVQVAEPDDSFGSLMQVMTEHRVRHVPVLDNGRLVGVLSIGDAVKYRTDQLEFERDQLNKYVSGG